MLGPDRRSLGTPLGQWLQRHRPSSPPAVAHRGSCQEERGRVITKQPGEVQPDGDWGCSGNVVVPRLLELIGRVPRRLVHRRRRALTATVGIQPSTRGRDQQDPILTRSIGSPSQQQHLAAAVHIRAGVRLLPTNTNPLRIRVFQILTQPRRTNTTESPSLPLCSTLARCNDNPSHRRDRPSLPSSRDKPTRPPPHRDSSRQKLSILSHRQSIMNPASHTAEQAVMLHLGVDAQLMFSNMFGICIMLYSA